MCNYTEEWWKIWRAIDLSFQNWHEEFDKFWPKHLKVSKSFTLMDSIWAKYILLEQRGVIFYDTEEWCKIWIKTDLWFWKWQEFGKFSLEHSKVSKLGLWWDPFIQSRKCMSLKFTEELCVMTMKNDAKFLRGIDLSFQNWHEEFDKFWPEHSEVSKICILMRDELRLIALKFDAKFDGKLTCAFKNNMRTLANFHRLKNNDFILESKMAELNQNKNSKQPDWPDAVWKR